MLPVGGSNGARFHDVARPPIHEEALGASHETTPADENSLYKMLQMFRRLGEILLLQWAWLKCWIDLVINGVNLYGKEDGDIKFYAPVVVIILGIVTTNLLGFLHFRQQGSLGSACVAALDLDTPVLACTYGPEVVRGETCFEWEKLRLRNSIWRRDLQLNGLNIDDLTFMHKIQEGARRIDANDKAKLGAIVSLFQEFEGETWAAAHCSESVWEETVLPRIKDVSQTWLTLFPPDMERIELGGMGSGNLAPLNFVFAEQWVALIRNNEELLRPAVLKVIEKSASWHRRLVAKHAPWGLLVDEAVHRVVSGEGNNFPHRTVQQTRPWTFDIGRARLIHINQGWKVKLFQNFVLLLVAVLPILKRILTTCKVRQPMLVGIVTFYAFLDLLSLAFVWIWCAAAPLAYNLGITSRKAIVALLPFFMEALERMEDVSRQDFVKRTPGVMASVFEKRGPGILHILKEDVLPTLEWDWPFFLGLVAGCLLFLALSAVIAWTLYGGTFVSSVSAGICGPLWLVSEESGNFESTTPMTKRLYFVVICRSILFAGIVTVAWWPIDSLSVQLFFAWISNNVVEVALLPYWLVFCAVHCVSGLAAAFAVELSLSSDTISPAEEALRYAAMRNVESSSDSGAYGTFLGPAKQGP